VGRVRLTAVLGLAALTVAVAACSGSGEGDVGGATVDAEPVVTQEPSDGRPTIGSDEADADEVEPNDDGPDRPPGVLVWIVGTEPPDLHLDDPANGLTVTAWIREGLLESLFGVGPDLTYHPELLAAEPTVTQRDDKSIVIDYRLRSGLRWSDGTPLTAQDVAYTHRILTEGCTVEADGSILDSSDEGCVYQIVDRVGLDQVTAFEVVDDTSFTVTMAGFYPDWRRLFSPVLAAHAYGDDAGQVNRRLRTMTGAAGPLPSSGPLRFDRWERGESIFLARNDDYHGSTAPGATTDGPATIDGVRIDFEPDPGARVEAIIDGRADLLMERARAGHRTLVGEDGVATTPVAGVDWEHWGLNLLNPHLRQAAVREAVAYAIDKSAVIEAVYRPLVGPELAAVGLGNTYWMATQPHYADHQKPYEGARPAEARQALAGAGYEPGPDGIQVHPDLGRLTLRVATTGGDPVRQAEQDIMVEQLEAAGIEVVVDNPPGGLFFQQGPFAPEALAASATGGVDGDPGLWDIAQFGWAGGPWPGGQSGAYRAGSPGNPYGFANPEFEVAAFECDAVLDDGERADCYNELDRFVTTLELGEDGLFMIPLVQRPVLVAHATDRLTAVPALSDSDMGGPLAAAVELRLEDVSPSTGRADRDDSADVDT
jgi:peptide/nickel transport system substrate-binding protein